MLDSKDILDSSKYSEYEAGRDLYSSKAISDFHMIPTLSGGKYQVSGNIKDINGKDYHAQVWVDENKDVDKIYSYHCECDKISGSLCRHMVALSFSFLKMRKAEILKKQIVPITKERKTSSDLADVIRKYAVTSETIEDKGKVHLDLYLNSNEDNGYLLQAKIGIDKKIVVQNLVKLAQDIAAKRKVTYSKSLTIVHDRMVFDEESKKRIDFVMELVKSEFSNFEDVIVVSNNYRTLLVNPFFMERLFSIYMNQEINLDGVKYHIEENNPKLCLIIKNENDFGISLHMDPVRIINGDRHDFVMNDQGIYCCSDEFSKDVVPFIRAMNTMSDKNSKIIYADRNFYFINREDYRAFCGNVLLKLQKHIGIVTEDIDFTDYMPTEAKISIYLDQSEDTVGLKLNAAYGSDIFEVFEVRKEDREFRDISKESQAVEVVSKYFDIVINDDDTREWKITDEEKLFDFLDEGIEELNNIADVYASESLNKFKVLPQPKVSVGISLKGDLIDISLKTDDIQMKEMYDLLESYKLRKKFYRLKTGEFLKIVDGNIAFLSDIKEELHVKKNQFEKGSISVPKFYAGFIDSSITENVTDDSIRRDQQFKKMIRDLADVGNTDFDVPEELHAKLRKYQKTGYRFLSVLSEFGFGGILADDMGLGKTLQVITLIEARKTPTVIVCPSSLVYNWESEINKFAPDLSVLTVIGDKKRRSSLLKKCSEYHIALTSYDLLKRDIEDYQKIEFDIAIIDEAQYIKNTTTQVSGAVKKLNAKHRFALTGTPIENRLSDLYSIFDFVMPGYLSTYQKFRDQYEIPIVLKNDTDVLNQFKKMVSPFILRRKKEDVLKDLPAKLENVMFVNMTKTQKELYDARFNALRVDIAKKSDKQFREDRLRVLAELTRLRQICCNPDICYEDYDGGSGKMDTCIEMIQSALEGEHRILVFSQFVQMLERIQDALHKLNINTLMLSGKNTKEERKHMVEEFQSEKVPVFLISLKAGGTGLNLTAADIVIHFDPWWNGAVQNQATDRAHRIGQIRTLTVMKLVTKDTIEEKIMELQEKKRNLADNVISGENMSSDVLSKDELYQIMQLDRNDIES